MARSRQKSKGRQESGPFIALPLHILESPEYSEIPLPSLKLLIDLLSQYNGFNNGDFCAAWTLMEPKGWRSRDTLARAIRDLLARGWIIKTRQGGRHKASLYAVTWKPIDDCKGKLDVSATKVASNAWRNPRANSETRQTCCIDTSVVPFPKLKRSA